MAAPKEGLVIARKRYVRGDPDVDVDVVVIGGGVNGVGVARDASMRGLEVALFERNDLAFGASGNSSGMIHGGPRYLTYDPAVTRSSCEDSGRIQHIAPHLLFRIPFLMPVENGPRARIMFTLLDAFFEAYDAYQPLKRGKPHARLTPSELSALEPGIVGDVIGGVTFDEWGIDGARLCVANAVDAMERGAKIFVGHTVEAIERREDDGSVCAVRYRDRRTGVSGRIRTKVVVNATGAWAPITASLSGLGPARARVRPGKGIHVVFDRRLTNYAIASQTIDNRQIFIEPWQNMSVIGTTDDDYYGDLDDVRATSDEVRYLVQGIARVFPQVRTARIIGTYAGVRPTLYEYGPTEDELSREHEVVDHAAHGAPGLFSMIGGKLASYRIFAEEMTDRLAALFEVPTRCATHLSHLPGGDVTLDPFAIASNLEIDAVAGRRLVYRHGGRALQIAERVHANPREAVTVCPCEPVIEAEVRYALKHELARSVADVSRRTRLGLGACGGMRCAARCGQIVAQELDLPPREGLKQAMQFLSKQALTRAVGLGPEQARQEAVAIAAMRAELGAPGSAEADTEEDGVTRSTLVIGAGAAGLAAAWSARRSGRDVTIVSSGVGASGLSSGALDAVPWDAPPRASASRSPAPELVELVRDLGIFHFSDPRATKLATMAGRLRSADGCDRALLDLGAIAAGRVLVPRVSRAGWDADAIAATLNDQPAASLSGHRFEAIDVTVLRFDNERPIVDADLAARHDDPARLAWLAARLREGLSGENAVAILLGPWLGAREPRAAALSELVGVPVGEALMGIGSPAGLRFEAARDWLLTSLGVARETSRVTRVVREGSRLRASLANGGDSSADDVVLAIGGLAGGGLRYEPAEHGAGDDLPARGRRAFCLSLEIDVDLALHGATLDIVSSLHGPHLDASAWPIGGRAGALEDVGVRCEGVLAAAGISAAGDAMADRPRTMLQAFASGIRAGAAS